MITRQSREFSVLDALQIGVILLDREGGVLWWNRWIASHLNPAPPLIPGRKLTEWFPELAGGRLEVGIQQALQSHLSSILTPGLNRTLLPLYHNASNGVQDRMPQLIQIAALKDSQLGCVIQVQDMTATVRRERRLKVQSSQLLDAAYLDALTGVGNRRRFDHAFAEFFLHAQRTRSRLSLMMVDVDFFKAYNDGHGHQKGDQCLCVVAQTIQQSLRQDAGDLICRYGGEEFAILLPGTDENTACTIAERLRQRVEALQLPYDDSSGGQYLSVSLGLATLLPAIGQRCELMLNAADLALYRAKGEGRNRCICYSMESHELRPCV